MVGACSTSPSGPDRDRREPLYACSGATSAASSPPSGCRAAEAPGDARAGDVARLSRNTVAQAYDELLAEESSRRTSDRGRSSRRRRRAARPARGAAADTRVRLVRACSRIACGHCPPGGARALYPAGPHRFDFRGGQVATDCLPGDVIKHAFAEALAPPSAGRSRALLGSDG
jgi:DNA-binding transcriptional MocR family regulator